MARYAIGVLLGSLPLLRPAYGGEHAGNDPQELAAKAKAVLEPKCSICHAKKGGNDAA